jgi:hypothetical protein
MEGLREPMAIGEVFSKSGMFPDCKSQAQAVVKILAGKEIGLTPFESMASIYIVNGKLALTSKAMSGLIKRSKKYDYSIKKLDDVECIIDITKDGEVVGTSTFTFKDAAKAGLVNKDVWKNYTRNMLFARAISNACRFYCPDVISGYYTTEELEDLGELLLEAHTKHFIRFIQHDVADELERERIALDQIEQPARRGDDNVRRPS